MYLKLKQVKNLLEVVLHIAKTMKPDQCSFMWTERFHDKCVVDQAILVCSGARTHQKRQETKLDMSIRTLIFFCFFMLIFRKCPFGLNIAGQTTLRDGPAPQTEQRHVE
jgi:hypothetical protein